MPGKSRRSRDKRFQSQRRREAQSSVVAQPPGTGPTAVATPPAAKPTPRAGAGQPAKSVIPQHPYVGIELVRIGILTGVILVILFVLAWVLPRA